MNNEQASKNPDPSTPSDGSDPSAELSEDELAKVGGGTVGSQSTGAGAGKVTFNPFSITRPTDKSSP
jgi:hypothetical protein